VSTDRGPERLDALAERALEVLVTHNEAVSSDDLACALGVSEGHAWEIANTLLARGYATVDEGTRTATAV
jgi:DNA-binding IclR family transcriptional regulator